MPVLKVKSLRSGKVYVVHGISGSRFLIWKNDAWHYEPIEFYVPAESGADKKLHKVIRLLEKEYERAKEMDFGRWIPVTEKLPDLIPCSVGTGYSEAVNVLTEGRKVLTAIWDGSEFIADADFWDAEGEKITHWTPVPLPLPQLPKGE